VRPLARFLFRPQNLLGLALVSLFVALAALAPSIVPWTDNISAPPNFRRIGRYNDMRPHPPSTEAPLGTLSGQYDVFYTIVWGSRTALRFGLLVTALTTVVGLVVGAATGYAGGRIQQLAIVVIDAFLAFPAIAGLCVVRYSLFPIDITGAPIGMHPVLAALGLDPLMIAFILFSWMPYARIANASALRLRTIDYVQAARSMGASDWRVVFRHVIPNLIAPIVVLSAKDVGGTVMLGAAFSFIGVATDLPWGTLLALGRDWIIGPGGNLITYWWVYAPATLALLLFGAGWNLLGDGLNDLIAGRQAAGGAAPLAHPAR
jgi:peptide/nickel transport system permease protein